MSKVSIVILNYNGENFLSQFLPTLIKSSGNHEVVVVDNASTDHSVEWVKQNFPDVSVIKFDRNHGFAGGYNEGLKQIQAEYYAIINSDIEVTDSWLDPIVDFLSVNDEYVACQPKIKDYHNRDRFEYAGAAGGFVDNLGFPYCRGRIFNELEVDEGQYDQVKDIFWSSGACMVIRSDIYHSLGGFDPDFFAHMEEIDLCWRINGIRKKIACVPSSVVYHVGGGTLSKSNPRKTYLNFRNGLSLLIKNLLWYQLWIIPVRMMLDLIAGIKFWKENDHRHFIAILRAHGRFLINIRRDWLKRRTIRKKAIPQSLVHTHSVVWSRYMKGRKRFRDLN